MVDNNSEPPPLRHRVVVHCQTPGNFVGFLTDVVGMTVHTEMDLASELLEQAMGWPPSEGTHLWILGDRDHPSIHVMAIPPSLSGQVPDGLAVLSFTTDNLAKVLSETQPFTASPFSSLPAAASGVDAAIGVIEGVPVEFMAPRGRR